MNDLSGTISVVIPVYRSQATLRELHRQIVAVLGRRGTPFEIILVEDCGGDESWKIIEDLARHDRQVRGIRFSRSFGQHNALLCGIRAAQYETIVTMDDDLQHPPEEIPALVTKLEEGYDVVYGAPQRARHGFLRVVAAMITKIVLASVMGARTAQHASAFRAFRTVLRDAFKDYAGPFVSIDVLLTWATTRFSYLTVRHDARRTGSSNYTVGKLVMHGLNMMTGFTTIPLQLASLLGFAFAVFGLVVLVYVLAVYWLRGDPVPGFPFLASVIAIFSGAQLFALGIIGEYLARIHLRSMARPPYVVGEEIANRPSPRGEPSPHLER